MMYISMLWNIIVQIKNFVVIISFVQARKAKMSMFLKFEI